MLYDAPKCYECQYLKKIPRAIGEKAACAKYDKVPDRIFFQAGTCSHFKRKYVEE